MGHKNRDGGSLTQGTPSRVRAAAGVCALLALLAPAAARAGNCQLTTAYGDIVVPPYDPFALSPVEFQAHAFDYKCSGNAAIRIEIDWGRAGASPRRMSNGVDALVYLLFQDDQRSTPWDGPLTAPNDGELWVYGSVPARQDVSDGAYADTVVVTLFP